MFRTFSFEALALPRRVVHCRLQKCEFHNLFRVLELRFPGLHDERRKGRRWPFDRSTLRFCIEHMREQVRFLHFTAKELGRAEL